MAVMSLLTRTRVHADGPDDSAGDRPTPLQSPGVVGALAGLHAGAAGLLAVVVPCLVVWLAAPDVSASWVEAVRIGADAWLLAHGATLALPAGDLSLVPLGLTLVPLLACWSAGRRVASALPRLRPGSSLVRARTAAVAAAALAGTYAALAALVAVVVATPTAHPMEAQAAGGGLLVALVGAALGLRHVTAVGSRIPEAVSLPLRAAAVALAAWGAASAALLAAALVLGWSRAAALAEALDAGFVGGAGLLVLQLALLPVAVVWAGAWFAGPGFAVGAGTSVTPAATSLGVLPALPVLGALPDPGQHSAWAWLVVSVPVLCGVLAGRCLRRSAAGQPAHLLRSALATAVLTGAGAALLCVWAGGAVGAGRMAELGPHPAWLGLALGGEVLAGCLVGIVVPRFGPRLPDHRPDWLPAVTWVRVPAWLRRPLTLRRPRTLRRPLTLRRWVRMPRVPRRRRRRR